MFVITFSFFLLRGTRETANGRCVCTVSEDHARRSGYLIEIQCDTQTSLGHGQPTSRVPGSPGFISILRMVDKHHDNDKLETHQRGIVLRIKGTCSILCGDGTVWITGYSEKENQKKSESFIRVYKEFSYRQR